MNILNPKPNNILSVTQQLLAELHVRYNVKTLTKNMVSHPYYPSMLTICDCLSAFKIHCDVYIWEKGDYGWDNLTFPFITYSAADGGNFTLVHEIRNNHIRLSNEKDKNILVPLTDFLASWEGIILHAKTNEKSGEAGFMQNYIRSLLHLMALPFFLLTTLSTIVFGFYNQIFNWLVLVVVMFKFIGVGISTALIARQEHFNHPLIKKLCGSDISNGCNTILKSKDAKITSWLSWAEIGFFYFSGSFLSLLILPSSLSFLYWANIVSLPFTFYSLIYQYRARKWCVLCCIVQVILVLEFIAFHSLPNSFDLDLKGSIRFVIPLVFCFSVPIFIWELVKSTLHKKTLVGNLQYRLDQFRYNGDLFSLTLNNQIRYELGDEIKPIILGNPEPNKVVTIVSNPYCEPCSKAHILIDQLMEQRKDIQVRIILISDNDSARVKVVQHMIALSSLQDKNLIQLALKDWYEKQYATFELWSEKYPVHINDTAKDVSLHHSKWAGSAGIMFTPTILVNGYILPEPYQLEDLIYLFI